MCSIMGLVDVKGVFSPRDRALIMKNLAVFSESRGTDATGFAYNHNDYLNIVKRPVAAHKMKLKLPDSAKVIIGHTRQTTQGRAALNYNNHPFFGKAGSTRFALVHNGILYNDGELRKKYKLPESKIKTDSFIAVQLIEHQKRLDFSSLRYMAETVMGVFTFAILDSDNNIWLIKGDNPLCLYYNDTYEFYVFASTEEILSGALEYVGLKKLTYTKVPISSGTMMKITPTGEIERACFDMDYGGFVSGYSHCAYGWRDDRDWDAKRNESTELQQLKEVAHTFGVAGEEIDLLLDYGYDVEDVEEMLNYPNDLLRVVQEIEYEVFECR